MKSKNLILSLYMILGILIFLSRGTINSAAASDLWEFRYEEIPKIFLVLLGVTFLLGGISYLSHERNAKGVCITFVGVFIILAYFFVLSH